MANFVRFTDTVEFKPIEILDNTDRRDSLLPVNNAPLHVKIAATHSGLITRNNGFYLPDRMKKGADTFIAHYGKPIQVHHDNLKDPIGRVVKATYVDTSANIKDKLIQRILNSYRGGLFNDSFIKGFLSGETSFIQSVNFIADALNTKNSILEDPHYQGLGYIELDAAITDPDAKQKILDGRYLTGSVGATTNRAVCSVCKADWTSDSGRCDHKPGKIYDGAKAFIIAGDLNYEEYSLVNVPADKHSRIIQVNTNGISDSVEMDSSFGKTMCVEIFTDHVDTANSNVKIDNVSKQGDSMNKEAILSLITTLKDKFPLVEESSFENIAMAVLGSALINDEDDGVGVSVAVETEMDVTSLTKIFSLTDSEKKLEQLKSLRPFMEETVLDTISKATYESVDKFVSAINDAEWLDYLELEDEALIAYKLENPQDSKLSGSARKKLPGSSFCGPNKSFPVPDCAHVTAARRLIGRASVSAATKTKILACVSRKSSAMNCSVKTEDSSKETAVKDSNASVQKIDFTGGNFAIKLDKYDAPIELITLADKEVIQGPGSIVLEMPFVLELMKELQEVKVAKDALVTELATVKTDHASTDKVIDALRTELKVTQEDLMQVNDRLVTQEESVISEKVQKIVLYKQLSGESIDDMTKLTDTLVTVGEEELNKQLSELVTKVDMKKIADSINSGLTRQPAGNIEDPTLKLEGNKYQPNRKKLSEVAETYLSIKLGVNHPQYGHGEQAAELYRRDMQSQGLFPNK